MFKFKYFLFPPIVLVIIMIFSQILVYADITQGPWRAFAVYLYYDNGNLILDRDYNKNIDLIQVDSFNVLSRVYPMYYAKIFLKPGAEDNQISTDKIFFDQLYSNQQFTPHKLRVILPYIEKAQEIRFYNNNGNELLVVFLNGVNFCLENKICEPEFGENNQNCAVDCVFTPAQSTPVLEESESKSSGLVKSIIYVLAGIGITFLAFRILGKRKDQPGY